MSRRLEHDPRKVGTGFRKRSCSNNRLKRDDDSKKSHLALVGREGGGGDAAVAPIPSNAVLPGFPFRSAAVYASKIEVVFEFTWEPSCVGQVPAQSGPTQHVVHYGQRVLTWHPARGHQPGHRNHGAALPHIVLEKFDEADGLWPAIAVDDDRRSAGRGLWNGSSQNAGPGSWGKHRIGSAMQQFGWQDSGRRRQNRQHELHEQHIQAVVRSVSPDSAVYGIKERGSIGVDQQPRHLLLHEVLAPATRQFGGTAPPVLIPEELGFQARSGLDRFNLGHRVPSAICGRTPIKRIDISMAKSRCGHSASLDRVMPVGLQLRYTRSYIFRRMMAVTPQILRLPNCMA